MEPCFELEYLWDKCHVSQQERQSYYSRLSKMMSSKESLQFHERTVDYWNKHYAKFKHILEKIENRQRAWQLMIVFMNRATRLNRLNNRKEDLLQAENLRKKLQNEIQVLENEIFFDIDVVEAEENSIFLYEGKHFKSLVTKQWENLGITVETNKVATTPNASGTSVSCTPASSSSRQIRSTVGEVTMNSPKLSSSISIAPQVKDQNMCKETNKRATTPNIPPSKLFKSATGTSVCRSVDSSNSKQVCSTVGKVTTKSTKPPSKLITVKKEEDICIDFVSESTKPFPSTSNTMKEKVENICVSESNSPARYNLRIRKGTVKKRSP